MGLSLTFIAAKLSESYPVELRDPAGQALDFESCNALLDLPSFRSARMTATGQKPTELPGVLPILTSTAARDLPPDEQAPNAIWIGDEEPPRGSYALWIPEQVEGLEVLNSVLDLLQFHDDWKTRVHDALLEGKPVPEVIAFIGEVTANPYWYADFALRALQMSEDRTMSERSSKWEHQRKTGRYPDDVISSIVSSGDLDRMNRQSCAWLFDDSESFSLPFVTKTIFLDGNVYGYLFIIELNPARCACDLEVAETMGNLIAAYIQHGNFGASRAERFIEQTLRTYFVGDDVPDEKRAELLELLGWATAPGFIVVAFDCQKDAGGNIDAPQALVELLRESLGYGRLITYGPYIIAITDTAERTCDEIEGHVEAACAHLGWKAGISDEFGNFADVGSFFEQAMIALQKGSTIEPTRLTYPYRDFGFAYLCQRLSQMVDRPLFMHPDIDRLIAYDRKNNSDLTRTLLALLANERNITKTAKELNLHRNSVVYRLGKINSIIQSDLDNSDNRIALLVSLKAWAYERSDDDLSEIEREDGS